MARRRHWFLLLVLTLASLSLARHVTAQTATPDDPLAARLGGTRTSFTAAFGQPIAPGTSDSLYDVPGTGLLAIQFQPEAKPGPGDRALVISLRSHRDATIPATSPSPADWRLSTARAFARQFLPPDVQIRPETKLDDHDLTATCTSATLARVLSGDCRISYVTPTPASVSFLTLSLGSRLAGTPAAIADPCAGLQSWAAPTRQRLDRATALLTEISTMTSTGNAAATQLSQYASQFGALAKAQRESVPPLAAASVNALLSSVFARYQEGLTLAVQAIKENDAAAARRATSLITSGNTDVANIRPMLQTVLIQCGVTAATPTASP